jgi:hypothetical protein
MRPSNRRLSWIGAALAALALAACTSDTVTVAGTVEVGDMPTAGPTDTAAPPTDIPAPTASSAPEEEESDMFPNPTPVVGGGTGVPNADVTYVRATQSEDGSWTFQVTVEHPDTGWEDYADGWDVVLPDGTVVRPDPDSPFTRLLLHPHETEQPFTRGQGGIAIPEGVTRVTVRAHDLVDGFGGREVAVDLSADSGPDFEVIRAP